VIPLLSKMTSIRCETLVVTSECDPIVPVSHGEKASSLIGNSTHLTLSEVGHLTLLEDSETFATSIGDFLR
jgi:pimeloyl-ACP methyl ester carboxylesterase